MRATAALLAILALAMFYTATGQEKLQQEPDAIFRFTSGTMLVLAGVLHLVFSVLLLFTRDHMYQGLQVLWLGLNHLLYHTGMVLFQAVPPFPMVQLLAWKFGLKARFTNGCWHLFAAYLLMGSILFLMLEWRRLGLVEAEAYLKHWKEVREQKALPGTVAKAP